MENSILEERSFSELIKLKKYLHQQSFNNGKSFDEKDKYTTMYKNVEKVILDKYDFEANNVLHTNQQPDN